MATREDIVNLAYANLRAKARISNLDLDTTLEAHYAKLYWPIVRRAIIEEWSPSFCIRREALELAPNETAPYDWEYVYFEPADSIKPRFINRDTQAGDEIKFAKGLSADGTRRLIYTNEKQVQLAFVIDVEDTSIYPPLFVVAFSWGLSKALVPTAAAGKAEMAQRADREYGLAIHLAMESDRRSETADGLPEADWIKARA